VANALFAGAALATVILVGGCSAGQYAQTAQVVPVVPGANSTPSPSGISLRNVLIEYPGIQGYRAGDNAPLKLAIFNDGTQPVTLVKVTTPGATSVVQTEGGVATGASSPTPTATGTPTDTSSSATGSPSASAKSSASASSTASSSASPSASGSASAGPSQAAGRPVNVQIPAMGYARLTRSGGATLELIGLTKALNTGESISITFVFSGGEQFTLDVPVDVPMSAAPRSPLVFESSTTGVG
jgi:copper(I)-binding protein